MRISTQLGSVMSGTAALALLAGCSGGGAGTLAVGGGSVAPQQQAFRSMSSVHNIVPHTTLSRVQPGVARPVVDPSYISPDAAKKGGSAFYLSDYSASTVTIFSTAGKQTGQITGFANPYGLAGDSKGNIWVANSGAGNILEYSAGLKKLEATLTESNGEPADVAVDSGTGAVGVVNVSGGEILFYAKGKTTPCATVTNSTLTEAYFVAFDGKGNLYVDGFNGNTGAVVVGEVSGECKAKSLTILSGYTPIAFPGGIQVAPNDDILIDDQEGAGSGSIVYTYKAPVKGKFGKPVFTTTLAGSSDAVTISINSTMKDIYTADPILGNGNSYSYPAGKLVKTYTATGAQSPVGALVTPDEQP